MCWNLNSFQFESENITISDFLTFNINILCHLMRKSWKCEKETNMHECYEQYTQIISSLASLVLKNFTEQQLSHGQLVQIHPSGIAQAEVMSLFLHGLLPHKSLALLLILSPVVCSQMIVERKYHFWVQHFNMFCLNENKTLQKHKKL